MRTSICEHEECDSNIGSNKIDFWKCFERCDIFTSIRNTGQNLKIKVCVSISSVGIRSSKYYTALMSCINASYNYRDDTSKTYKIHKLPFNCVCTLYTVNVTWRVYDLK